MASGVGHSTEHAREGEVGVREGQIEVEKAKRDDDKGAGKEKDKGQAEVGLYY